MRRWGAPSSWLPLWSPCRKMRDIYRVYKACVESRDLVRLGFSRIRWNMEKFMALAAHLCIVAFATTALSQASATPKVEYLLETAMMNDIPPKVQNSTDLFPANYAEHPHAFLNVVSTMFFFSNRYYYKNWNHFVYTWKIFLNILICILVHEWIFIYSKIYSFIYKNLLLLNNLIIIKLFKYFFKIILTLEMIKT